MCWEEGKKKAQRRVGWNWGALAGMFARDNKRQGHRLGYQKYCLETLGSAPRKWGPGSNQPSEAG